MKITRKQLRKIIQEAVRLNEYDRDDGYMDYDDDTPMEVEMLDNYESDWDDDPEANDDGDWDDNWMPGDPTPMHPEGRW
jgi:hypothetical protein